MPFQNNQFRGSRVNGAVLANAKTGERIKGDSKLGALSSCEEKWACGIVGKMWVGS